MPTTEIAGILGTGTYFPKKREKIETIAKEHGFEYDKVLQEHGVLQIHVAQSHETELYMAVKASQDALQNSRLNPKSIDLVIYCKGLSEKKSAMPFSSQIINELKAKEAYGFDIDAGFVGGLIGLQIANDILANNFSMNNALIVASQEFDEIYLFEKGASRLQNMVFGDGAAAVLISKNALNNKILSSSFVIDHQTEFIDNLLRSGHHEKSITSRIFRRMKRAIVKNISGNPSILTQKWVENSYKAIDDSIKSVKLEIADINHFVKTQLSLKETELLAHKLNLDANSIYNVSSEKGHLGQTDILSNLYFAFKNKDFRNLDIILLVAANYDCSSGAIVLRR